MRTIATFEVEFTQYLDANGKAIHPLPNLAQDADALLKLYSVMRLNRALDLKAVSLQRTGKMGTYASSLGQEAIPAMIGHCLKKDDVFIPYYRDYAAMIQRDVSLVELLCYWGGDERGSRYQDNQHDLPISVPIASQCLHACGVAFALQYQGTSDRVALVTCGDGGTSEGDFYEAMNLAGTWQLPLVFVINNNQWAISVPRAKQTHAQTLAQKAIAAGFTGEQVDGNDIFALHTVISRAIDRARNGKGPTLIEALSYRLCDHTTADDASRYCPSTELEAGWEQEPIKRLKAYLMAAGHWDEEQDKQLTETIKKQVDTAVDDYLALPKPSVADIFDYHYAKLPANLAQQKQAALEEYHDSTHAG